jgi:hypothetical protein
MYMVFQLAACNHALPQELELFLRHPIAARRLDLCPPHPKTKKPLVSASLLIQAVPSSRTDPARDSITHPRRELT